MYPAVWYWKREGKSVNIYSPDGQRMAKTYDDTSVFSPGIVDEGRASTIVKALNLVDHMQRVIAPR